MHYELADLLRAAEWRSNFDKKSLARAQAYARDGSVRGLQIQHDGAHYHLTAKVDGNYGHRYGCQVEVGSYDRQLVVEGICSCPVRHNCKHAAAMLLQVAASDTTRPAPAASSPDWAAQIQAARDLEALASWERWLASLERVSRPMPTADLEHRFGILLRSSGAPWHRLLALPVWLRPSRSRASIGNLVDPQPLKWDDHHGAMPAPVEGWPEPMALALNVLLAAPVTLHGSTPWLSIRSFHAERALEQLLARYPAWYERGSQPVARGPDVATTLDWVEAGDGSQRLQMRPDADGAQLLVGAGLWYIDAKAGHYGRAQGDARLFEMLETAPALAPRQLAAVRGKLAASSHRRRLPAPIEHGPIRVVRAQPTPVLRLHPVPVESWNGRIDIIGMAALRHDYDGHAVDDSEPANVLTRLDERGLHEIHRDRAAEAHWQQSLRKLGLTPREELDTSYVPDFHRSHLDDWYARTSARKPPLAPDAWAPLVEQLEQAGFRIDYAEDFPRDRLLRVDAWHAELSPSGHAWFDVALGVDVAGERIDLLPVLRQLIFAPDFPLHPARGEKTDASWRLRLDDTRSIALPLTQLRGLIEPLFEWLTGPPNDAPRLHRSQLATLGDSGLAWRGDDGLRTLLQQLRTRQPAKPPRGLKATLRPYQREGLAWLDFLGDTGLGGILADDMGLGKTVQVLAHLLAEKQRKRLADPALVIAPTSLVGNWQAEAARFAPSLKVLVLHGSDRAEHFGTIAGHHLVITTYPLLPRDRDKLVEAKFSLLILDEAQAIKNAASRAAQVVREIPATRRLAMTGTPLENHLGELWAQFDVVEPGLLGNQRQFARRYRTPIEKHGDPARQQQLNRRIGPLLLRRRKDDVLTDLPPKTEIVRTLELEADQRALYETLRLAQHERVRQAVKERGLAQSGIVVLDALLKLRQACCDPRLVKLDSARKVKTSAKLDALLDLIDGLVNDGRRILLFSQFTEMLALIEAALDKRKLPHQALTGQTPARDRTALVKRFQQGDVPLFLISLKAGGVGLNLTAADTVIHYAPGGTPPPRPRPPTAPTASARTNPSSSTA
ncbi:SNF2-related protein [Rhodanobacter caeni]|uniref:Helicase SNF2 n=1 Tax=Rhodanobacter caeni TaxID=657654 RepID=A0ABP3E064_9GAMM